MQVGDRVACSTQRGTVARTMSPIPNRHALGLLVERFVQNTLVLVFTVFPDGMRMQLCQHAADESWMQKDHDACTCALVPV